MRAEVLAILLALAALMAIAYRGLPVIVFAPACAMLAVGLSGRAVLPSYTETFMGPRRATSGRSSRCSCSGRSSAS